MGLHGLAALQQILDDVEDTAADPRIGRIGRESGGMARLSARVSSLETYSLDDFSLDTGALLERLTRAGEVLKRERQEVGQLLGEILDTPPSERPERITQPRYQSFLLADALLAQSELYAENDPEIGHGDVAFEDPDDLAELPTLALAIATRLNLARHPPALIEDLKARAWTALGDAYLRAGDVGGAERALREGVQSLARGSGDLLVEARMLELESDLMLEQGGTVEADALLRQAVSRLREARETGLLARLATKRQRVAERAQASRAMGGWLPHSRR